MKTVAARALVSLLVLLAPTPALATIVVDAAGGGDFTSLEEALVAAADGEQVLVRSGTYGAFGLQYPLVAGKGLSIVADTGATVVIPGLRVTGVPAGHWVIVRGLTIDALAFTGDSSFAAVEFTGPDGALWLEDCTIHGDKGYADQFFPFVSHSRPAVAALGGGSVTLQRCTLVGGEGWPRTSSPMKWPPGVGAPGVLADGGRVALHGCTVTGGLGGLGDPFVGTPVNFPPDGGAGIEVRGGGFAHVAGSDVTGGSNGDNNNIDDDQSGDGLLVLAPATAWLRDSQFQPGSVVKTGLPGQAIEAPPGAVTTFAAPARSLSVDSPLREGQAGALQVQGVPGDQVVVLVALGAGFAPFAGKQGVFSLDTSVLLLPLGLGTITDPGGSLTVPFVTPTLNPALEGLTVPLQLLVIAAGAPTLEASTALAWLDAGL